MVRLGIIARLLAWPFYRRPDVIIGAGDVPYMRRWHVIPRNRWFNIYLHHFLRSDDDRALHDHPWPSLGIILKGSYIEHMPENPRRWRVQGCRQTIQVVRRAFRPVFRRADHIHRVELLSEIVAVPDSVARHSHRGVVEKTVWTLFITGPKIREWGFWCSWGFRHWELFTHESGNKSVVGRGCE